MTPSFEAVQKLLKQLPGLGYRSAERIALNLLVERPDRLNALSQALQLASEKITRCNICGNLCEDQETCSICSNSSRNRRLICVVQSIPDLYAIERSGSYFGSYHVLHGKLSPIKDVNPNDLNLVTLKGRLDADTIAEVILALDNDIEGRATCHYIIDSLVKERPIKVSRIGFGLPSGGGVVYADSVTLKNAIESRRSFE